ncbi:bifunctional 2-C-methyl-D-erythritol 4-phosphate cytidylyltransferase/2-C-methyl-D-erythritol 2,4-cyclodiphosphate synthase [Helicobacter turcicus]|uniref:Bifunctional enzyme IspD/IspF n=1 Tax=Helicobacter turcicus TaxID=2867412 RepID=A0ABS7JKN7_9HELI|nr:bifunctional 2-C-methyl-D-erythritol 4-phosphate cytidylyltransferase/2-C-methyl-D-erythritol 2,4-cyclodiphosphate synthase [Helicobacter turcicus]MBX7489951.1 bifunctional 2-C-methyl-D-erythritol 4-phosphate cytidylyltransferase/2-C-methyl-D-erythritol 2,4-cyclodiphosphate synthase [Helicobacter turcicus]MBX7544810.1 bifunctional 2-C-methyl-D-erythritol 4-phosphate cytidylyltransferase/2-C-methyl-D-erythritol 2,4-cyclodiphosphate synthase [Helicobacter turcicus]
MTKIALILLGAGESSRFRDSTQDLAELKQKNIVKLPKKQWIRTGEIPLWLKVAKELHSAYLFCDYVLSAAELEIPYMQKYLDSFNLDFKLARGGTTRQESLKNAINILDTNAEFVFVSDIARCNIPQTLCQKILQEAGKYDCVVPFLNLHDTIAYEDSTLQYLKREQLKIIQTPQLSRLSTLKESFKQGDFTDESSGIFAIGGSIGFIKGEQAARKLTFLQDLEYFKLPYPSNQTLVGTGSDIHALTSGNGIVLGGIPIACPYKLIAHSDGDVCLHALCDAILGAIGAGDIGKWFPDSDSTYKDADSKELLAQIVDFVYSVGYSLKQADITIFAQKPKLLPFKSAMESQIAELLGIPKFKVNVKATTTEKLGFVGREEGIFVQASVVLGYFNWKNLLKGVL